jgi:hypothetical protein
VLCGIVKDAERCVGCAERQVYGVSHYWVCDNVTGYEMGYATCFEGV